jgi:hypothetical protein
MIERGSALLFPRVPAMLDRILHFGGDQPTFERDSGVVLGCELHCEAVWPGLIAERWTLNIDMPER